MKVKHAPLVALCTMATTIVAMGVSPTPLSTKMFIGGMAHTSAELEMLMTDAHELAEHLGCTEPGCIDDALMLLNDNNREML